MSKHAVHQRFESDDRPFSAKFVNRRGCSLGDHPIRTYTLLCCSQRQLAACHASSHGAAEAALPLAFMQCRKPSRPPSPPLRSRQCSHQAPTAFQMSSIPQVYVSEPEALTPMMPKPFVADFAIQPSSVNLPSASCFAVMLSVLRACKPCVTCIKSKRNASHN